MLAKVRHTISIFRLSNILCIYLLFLVTILLLPFCNKIKTFVEWLSNSHGIKISSASVIRSTEPPRKLYNAMIEGEGITLDAWITVDDVKQKGPARIISYSYGTALRNFTLGQNNRDLIFRLRTTSSDLNGVPQIVVKNVFSEAEELHIAITYDFSQYIVYVNGEPRTRENRSGNFSNWDTSYFLTLANELSSDRPWLGTIHAIGIYNRSLSHSEIITIYNNRISGERQTARPKYPVQEGLMVLYLFNEGAGNIVYDACELKPTADLYIPATICVGKIPNRTFLAPLNLTNIKDILINIILFIPFGFLLQNILKKRNASSFKSSSIVLLTGIAFTLSIESLQSLIETRSSSITDVITNSLGVLIGIIVARIIEAKFQYNYLNLNQ